MIECETQIDEEIEDHGDDRRWEGESLSEISHKEWEESPGNTDLPELASALAAGYHTFNITHAELHTVDSQFVRVVNGEMINQFESAADRAEANAELHELVERGTTVHLGEGDFEHMMSVTHYNADAGMITTYWLERTLREEPADGEEVEEDTRSDVMLEFGQQGLPAAPPESLPTIINLDTLVSFSMEVDGAAMPRETPHSETTPSRSEPVAVSTEAFEQRVNSLPPPEGMNRESVLEKQEGETHQHAPFLDERRNNETVAESFVRDVTPSMDILPRTDEQVSSPAVESDAEEHETPPDHEERANEAFVPAAAGDFEEPVVTNEISPPPRHEKNEQGITEEIHPTHVLPSSEEDIPGATFTMTLPTRDAFASPSIPVRVQQREGAEISHFIPTNEPASAGSSPPEQTIELTKHQAIHGISRKERHDIPREEHRREGYTSARGSTQMELSVPTETSMRMPFATTENTVAPRERAEHRSAQGEDGLVGFPRATVAHPFEHSPSIPAAVNRAAEQFTPHDIPLTSRHRPSVPAETHERIPQQKSEKPSFRAETEEQEATLPSIRRTAHTAETGDRGVTPLQGEEERPRVARPRRRALPDNAVPPSEERNERPLLSRTLEDRRRRSVARELRGASKTRTANRTAADNNGTALHALTNG